MDSIHTGVAAMCGYLVITPGMARPSLGRRQVGVASAAARALG